MCLLAAATPADAESELVLVPAARMQTIAGRIEPRDGQKGHVSSAGMRAFVRDDASRGAELSFRYLGPTAREAPLASGELRRQIGLSLRGRDTCNVVYVMWHVSEPQGVFVSVKSNPSMSTHAECGARGYSNPKPSMVATAPELRVGVLHRLRADLAGDRLRVRADGATVWEGDLPASAMNVDGPVGVRTDNAEFDFEYRVAGAAASRSLRGNP